MGLFAQIFRIGGCLGRCGGPWATPNLAHLNPITSTAFCLSATLPTPTTPTPSIPLGIAQPRPNLESTRHPTTTAATAPPPTPTPPAPSIPLGIAQPRPNLESTRHPTTTAATAPPPTPTPPAPSIPLGIAQGPPQARIHSPSNHDGPNCSASNATHHHHSPGHRPGPAPTSPTRPPQSQLAHLLLSATLPTPTTPTPALPWASPRARPNLANSPTSIPERPPPPVSDSPNPNATHHHHYPGHRPGPAPTSNPLAIQPQRPQPLRLQPQRHPPPPLPWASPRARPSLAISRTPTQTAPTTAPREHLDHPVRLS